MSFAFMIGSYRSSNLDTRLTYFSEFLFELLFRLDQEVALVSISAPMIDL